MNVEYVGIWEETVVTYPRYYTISVFEETGKNYGPSLANIDGSVTKIRRGYL
jgi:hypothetical protein